MSKPRWLIFLIINALVMAMVLAPGLAAEQIAQGSMWHGFPISEMGDYFHYVYMIKSGQEGRVLFHNAYTEESFPDLIIQPFYNLLGFATGPFQISPYVVFYVARLLGILLLLSAVFYLATLYLGAGAISVLALILFAVNTSIYGVTELQGHWTVTQDPETYSWMFNIFRKFTMLPVHYFFAWTAAIGLLIGFAKSTAGRWQYGRTVILGTCLAWLHPYLAMGFLYVFAGFAVFRFITSRTISRSLLLHIVAYALSTIPVMVYHGIIFATFWNTSTATQYIFRYTPPPISLTNYLLALGPVAFVAFLSLWNPSSYTNSLFVLLALWAFLPIVLLYLPIPIPVASVRLFQMYQQIPLSLLSAGVVAEITKRLPRVRVPILLVVAGIFTAYAVPSYVHQYQEKINPAQPFFAYYAELTAASGIFSYLNINSKPDSVVLAGEKLSSVIPTLTNNRVILGHDGDQRNFYAKRDEMFGFFAGAIPQASVKDFLKKYHISYVIFGIDPFAGLPQEYTSLPYFKEVYSEKYISGKMILLQTVNLD